MLWGTLTDTKFRPDPPTLFFFFEKNQKIKTTNQPLKKYNLKLLFSFAKKYDGELDIIIYCVIYV